MMQELVNWLQLHGLLSLALGFMLQGVGVPLPMAALFAIAGTLIHAGDLSPVTAVAGCFAGCLAGNLLGYGAGWLIRHRHPRAVWPQRLPFLSVERTARLEAWVTRHGPAALVPLRWIGLGYAQAMWLLGLSHTSFLRFLAFVAVADLTWVAFWTLVGRQAVNLLTRLWP